MIGKDTVVKSSAFAIAIAISNAYRYELALDNE